MSATVQMPQLQLESLSRVLELPVVELAVDKTCSTYSYVKDSHNLINWALSTAESAAVGLAAPTLLRKLERPISFFDYTICRGLDTIEKRVPMVKEKPDIILESAYMKALETVVLPATTRINYANEYVSSHASMIKNTSWNKINEILSTQYGNAVVHGVDNTAACVDELLDKYFPPIAEEKLFTESVPADEDKLLHTLQTVGRLSNKAARRVYSHVVHQLRTLKKESLRSYLANLVEFLQLARYVSPCSTSCSNNVSNGKPSSGHSQSEQEEAQKKED